MRIPSVILLLVALVSIAKGQENVQGTCAGTCVDIRNNPSCNGFIHLRRCLNGLGCCLDGGTPYNPAPGPAPYPSGPSYQPAPAPYQPPEDIQGTCTGTCVNIRNNPTCPGYIHLNRCKNRLGCCIDYGPSNYAPRPAENPSYPAPGPYYPAPAPAPAPYGDVQGSCVGTCVDIKQRPNCPTYIHLNQCRNGLGCCRSFF